MCGGGCKCGRRMKSGAWMGISGISAIILVISCVAAYKAFRTNEEAWKEVNRHVEGGDGTVLSKPEFLTDFLNVKPISSNFVMNIQLNGHSSSSKLTGSNQFPAEFAGKMGQESKMVMERLAENLVKDKK